MRKYISFLVSSVGVSMFFIAVGCTSASGPSIDPARSNCNTVCNKIRDCGDANFDTTKCSDDCTSRSDREDVYEAKIKECAECAEPKACSEVNSCAGDCLKTLFP